MATSTTKLDPHSVQVRLLEVVRGLLGELGNSRAEQNVYIGSHLERDLGLGSLERVELLVRVERVLGVRLPDRVMAQAETLSDVATALVSADFAATLDTRRAEPVSTPLQPQPGTATAVSTPKFETLQQALSHRGRAEATRAHLIFWADASSESPHASATTVTFGDLYEGAHRFAVELAHRGVSPGDVVSLMLPTSPEFFFAFAGVLLAGAVPAPIYPPIRADHIEEYADRQSAILSNAQAKLLVTFREAASVARLLRPRIPSLDGVVTAAELLAERSSDLPLPGLGHGDDIALLQYTSGSTGDPKGVTLSHNNLLANIRALGEALDVRPNDVGVSWLPLYHDMGLIGAWLGPLCFGIPVVVMSPLEFLTRPERWLWALHRYRGTLSAAPNFAYELCVSKTHERDLNGLDLSSWRAALNGAEPVLPETLDRFAERFARYGFRREALTPVYGLAEASLGVTFPSLGRGPRVDRIDRKILEETGRAVSVAASAVQGVTDANDSASVSFVCVGRPVASCEVRIVADASDQPDVEQGRDAGERREGQLWFRGSSATRGYYRNPEATAGLFPLGAAAGWVNSGDRAYRADGEYYITGRTKDIIVKAGRNLYPHEIENAVANVAGVRRGCVVAFGIKDAASGTERLVVVAETRERSSAVREKLAAAITQQVARAVGVPPDTVLTVPPHSIPKTSSGKLRRDGTKQLYQAGVCGAPSSPPWLQVARLALKGFARTAFRIARSVPEKLYGVYAAVVFGMIMVPAWVIVLPVRNRKFVAGVAVGFLRLCFLLIGSPIRVSGRREHLAVPGGYVLVSNHASYMDVLVLMAGLGTDFHIVSKSEVRKMPVIGTFLHKLDHFWFDRGDSQARLRQAGQIEQALREGESVYVFPEGTFTPQVGVRPFQLGAFQAAVRAGHAVVPIALCGTRRFLRDDTYLPRPTRLEIRVGPPIQPHPTEAALSWQEILRLRDTARDWIAREAGEPLL
ncbi:MAG: AMP-binding protein [Candidatus Acidiferrales bacterium]